MMRHGIGRMKTQSDLMVSKLFEGFCYLSSIHGTIARRSTCVKLDPSFRRNRPAVNGTPLCQHTDDL